MDTVTITIPDKDSFVPLLRLVLGAVAMRKNVCYDDLDDVQLAVDDLLSGRMPNQGHVTMTVQVRDNDLDITVDALVDESLCRRLRDGPAQQPDGEQAGVVDTCLLLRSLMDGYEVLDLPAGRFSVRMTKHCQ